MSAPEDGAYEYPRLRPVEVFPTALRGQQVFCLRDPMHYTDAIVSVPPQTAAILDLFDGRHSLLDIQEAFARRFGVLLFREQLQQVIQSLDDCLLLESPRFASHRESLQDDFRRTPHRPARLAGKAYPSDPEALRRELDGYFVADGGPKDTPPSPAAVILGTSHVSIERPFALTRKVFETPLGPAEVDEECLEAMISQVGHGYLDDEFAHRGEHSIEFQGVFLRHATPARHPVRIVPILCGSFHKFVEERRPPENADAVEEFLAALRETLAAVGGRTVVIASADLAHVGPQFGDPRPLTPGQLREIEEADRRMLSSVEAGDAEGFFRAVARDGDRRHICGLPPIYAALRVLDGHQGRLIRYGQWPDPNGTVTFAALALYRPE
ncbi:MAG: putative dioxygenase [candidate division NC10 bacterium]|nr:putative dioxygenase [candidate division NC10 bacterium]